ncbi:CYTH domain-containing protein [Ruegeria sp. HKCCD4884]|uniref:CYTH domain-containing protein n=1 Tax=Ruegeria sp. HKCCD4884 TaxID=2683022 RepID=UPI001492046D|nr:CYTH domain-containing protein [Ruegeria sp. HKCCD4884]NOD91264.1 CYTH domain-containing protein [Ruegeria sp. HKCCD4884]
MSKEIERKFLVATLPDLSSAQKAVVRQGYLTAPDDSTELRLRQKNEAFFLTLKGGGGLVRVEREAQITEEQFETFWPETEGRRVEKERYTGRLPDGLMFELDIFSGDLASLRLVEVEFDSEEDAAAFVPPDWFGADVTEDKRYKNKTMATEGIPF